MCLSPSCPTLTKAWVFLIWKIKRLFCFCFHFLSYETDCTCHCLAHMLADPVWPGWAILLAFWGSHWCHPCARHGKCLASLRQSFKIGAQARAAGCTYTDFGSWGGRWVWLCCRCREDWKNACLPATFRPNESYLCRTCPTCLTANC